MRRGRRRRRLFGRRGVSITIFNSKSEVQSQFEAMAEEYSKTKGVNVEIYYSNDTVAAHMATKYSANDALYRGGRDLRRGEVKAKRKFKRGCLHDKRTLGNAAALFVSIFYVENQER